MGKGTRNRDQRMQDKIDHPEKYKEKKHAPKWLTPAISILVLIAIVFGTTFSILQKNATFERARVLVKSETGKFDVTQPMATFLAWESAYYEAYYYYLYVSYGIYEDTNGIQDYYGSAENFALNQAYYATQNSLRDSVDTITENMLNYVGVCDAAEKAGVVLTDEDKENAESTFEWLDSIREWVGTNYGFTGNAKQFYNDFISRGLKKSDIQKANNLVALYNKYYAMQKYGEETSVAEGDVKKYVTENPAGFFSTDYLTYSTHSDVFADQLKTVSDKIGFNSMILENLFDDNVENAYREQTIRKPLRDGLAKKVNGKTNANGGTALSDAIAEAGMTEKTYAEADIPETEVREWLFDAERREGNTAVLEGEGGSYAVIFVSAADEKVTGAYEFFAYEDIDETMKQKLKAHLLSDLVTKPETAYQPEGYKTANDYATEFKNALAAEGADEAELFADKTVEEKTVTSATTDAEIAKVILEAVRAETAVVGNTVVDGDGVSYFVKIKSLTKDEDDNVTAEISYVEFKGDVYFDIFNSLKSTISEKLPEEQTYTMPAEVPDSGYEAWLMAKTADESTGLFKSQRVTGDSEVFQKNDSTDIPTYNVYLVINEPLYMKKDPIVYGGYITFTDSGDQTAAAQADEALAKVAGKSGYDLLAEMNRLNATVSTTLDESSVTNEKVKEWIFSDDRKANDTAKIESADGKSVSVVCFFSENETWYRNAKDTIVSNHMDEWLKDLRANYTVDEKNLAKLGEASTTVVTE